MNTDYLQYYDLEDYLFRVVSQRYSQERTLSVFDFFCIIIWKANRAKSKIAERLLKISGCGSLDPAVQSLIAAISNSKSPKEKLSVLIEDWGFRLPMGSAILTVLYPHDFTVYDIRVCEELGDFKDVQHKKFESLWKGYDTYIMAVKGSVPEYSGLRDKDRFLWGKSFATQLRADIRMAFGRRIGDED